jgi:hypothetical protein
MNIAAVRPITKWCIFVNWWELWQDALCFSSNGRHLPPAYLGFPAQLTQDLSSDYYYYYVLT